MLFRSVSSLLKDSVDAETFPESLMFSCQICFVSFPPGYLVPWGQSGGAEHYRNVPLLTPLTVSCLAGVGL